MARSATQAQRVEQMLRAAGPSGVTNGTFAVAGILRYAARLEELRNRGFVIETQRVKGGTFRYVLISEPDAGPGGDASRGVMASDESAAGSSAEPDLFAVEDGVVQTDRYRDWDEAA